MQGTSHIGSWLPPQGIREISSTQLLPLGTRLQMNGKVFYYAEAGATALAPGKLMQSPVPAADHTGLAVTSVAAGQKSLTLTNGASTAFTKNQYRNGELWVDSGTSVGHGYSIKGNAAAGVNATCVFTLYEELVELLVNATDTISLACNPYANIIICPSVPTALLLGVTPVDVTGDYFFWLQTWGLCPVLTTDTVVIGNTVSVADDDDGAVQASDDMVEQVVGTVVRVEADTEYSLVYLRLAN